MSQDYELDSVCVGYEDAILLIVGDSDGLPTFTCG